MTAIPWQGSPVFQLESSGLRNPERIDRLLLVVAIAVLPGSLQVLDPCITSLRARHKQAQVWFSRIELPP